MTVRALARGEATAGSRAGFAWAIVFLLLFQPGQGNRAAEPVAESGHRLTELHQGLNRSMPLGVV